MASNPHGIRAAFFDVDGTLVSFETHQMVPSAARALQALRAAGIHPVLATGRPPYQLAEVPLELFDAYLMLNGQRCEADGRVLRDEPIDPAALPPLLEQIRSGAYECLFQGFEECFLSGRNDAVRGVEAYINYSYVTAPLEHALEMPIYQLNAYLAQGEELIEAAAPGVKCVRWHPAYVDVIPADGGKDVGVAAILSHWGIEASAAAAFGDGQNDADMLAACGIGVAMGNANDAVKAHADYVAPDCDDYGVWRACMELGLIDG